LIAYGIKTLKQRLRLLTRQDDILHRLAEMRRPPREIIAQLFDRVEKMFCLCCVNHGETLLTYYILRNRSASGAVIIVAVNIGDSVHSCKGFNDARVQSNVHRTL
jgi:hypothetical protein